MELTTQEFLGSFISLTHNSIGKSILLLRHKNGMCKTWGFVLVFKSISCKNAMKINCHQLYTALSNKHQPNIDPYGHKWDKKWRCSSMYEPILRPCHKMLRFLVTIIGKEQKTQTVIGTIRILLIWTPFHRPYILFDIMLAE